MYASMETFLTNKTDIIIHYYDKPETQVHSHDFFELVYIKEGSGIHYFKDNKVPIKAGDYFIIELNTPHKYKADENQNLFVINCIFRARIIDSALSSCKSFKELVSSYLIKFNRFKHLDIPTEHIFHDADKKIITLIESIDNEVEKKNIGHREVERCYLIELLITMMRNIYIVSPESSNLLVQTIIDYIEQNFNSEISLNYMSTYLNYSASYISRKFKEITGESFISYLQQRRVDKACRLLANQQIPIHDIVNQVGFSDYKHFLNIFKKHVGVSPQQFRNLHAPNP